ncbi:MAG: bifunctional chorismate mutase/prephenate dehydrogenase [Phycisphaerales bacterium]|nr:bifunctional chorismate mutase/prephenate dehydrogenase [Phycisphaerales bacterium]
MPDPVPQDLLALRQRIDQLDRRFVELLAERNELVAQVADVKRQSGFPIRDPDREGRMLAERRTLGTADGIRPEVVESLFRVILWASRDRQASLRAAVPVQVEPRTIAIVGGLGGMGTCLSKMFQEQGHEVLISDLDTTLRPNEAAARADVTVISVNIRATREVIELVGPNCREDALLCDVTSIKDDPVRAMVDFSSCTTIGTHPLFGPAINSLQGQRVVVTPGRINDDAWLKWLESSFKAAGLEVIRTAPEQHDRIMSVVQVLTHYSTEVIGRTMQTLGVSIEESLQFTSPIYHMELLMAARHFAQSPDLYSAIEMTNPNADSVTEAFTKAADELRDLITTGDQEGFRRTFGEVRSFFGDFSEKALVESSYLIDRLVERT